MLFPAHSTSSVYSEDHVAELCQARSLSLSLSLLPELSLTISFAVPYVISIPAAILLCFRLLLCSLGFHDNYCTFLRR